MNMRTHAHASIHPTLYDNQDRSKDGGRRREGNGDDNDDDGVPLQQNVRRPHEDVDDEFYSDKLTLSKFYIEQLLPLSSGYASAVTAGKEDLYAMKAENF